MMGLFLVNILYLFEASLSISKNDPSSTFDLDRYSPVSVQLIIMSDTLCIHLICLNFEFSEGWRDVKIKCVYTNIDQ